LDVFIIVKFEENSH